MLLAVVTVSTVRAQSAGWSSSFARPHPAVVRVVAPERDGMSLGSGSLVAISGNFGLVITNWHVVRDAAGQVGVIFPDGFRSAATVARTNRDWDLAALVIWRPNVSPIPVSTQAPQPGDTLTIAGYGSGPYRAVSGRCTEYLSPSEHLPAEMVELDAAARQGDSGGPILNSRGELAGVLFGTGFGRTAGSYCGRVRWFIASIDADFQRLSSQTTLAQQANPNPAPTAAIPAAQAVAQPVAQPAAQPVAQPLAAVTPSSPTPPTAHPVAAHVPPPSPPSASPAVSAALPRSSATATISAPSSPSIQFPTADRMKTVLAVIGAIAILYSSLRLLGRAVG
ncbi:MAG: serine protease [Planctomycetaceae bacterium]|nr:serine protease [Planctomycetaceae bacterium]